MTKTYLALSLTLLGFVVALMVTGHDRSVRSRPVLAINFDHANHGKINCVTCHHDFADGKKSFSPSGSRTCILCHKESPELALSIQHDFHQICQSCHLQSVKEFKVAGPVKSCKACHTPEALLH